MTAARFAVTNGTILHPKCDILFIPDGVLGAGEAMRRREFIAFVGAVAAWPLASRAQQRAMPVIGFMNAADAESDKQQLAAFLKGLEEVGYVDGKNVAIEYRWAEANVDRLPAIAADLVQRKVSVIAATTTPAALAAKAATKTIPIVFETGSDPIRLGLVASLNRPGGNVTGVTQLNSGLVAKELEVLHELLPTVKTVALLVNPADPAVTDEETREAASATQILGLELHVLKASTQEQLEAVFANLSQSQISGLVVGPEVFFTSRIRQLAALAVRHKVPTIYRGREFAAAGGLVSYGSTITSSYHLAGVYTGRVLKGEKPADLPVQQATKFELYINLKTAKALGITVPLPLSGRADEVIE
jgi:putative ABC transport system substrate-binding protein